MRILPPQGPGDDGLVHRLGGLLNLAKTQGHDVFFYGGSLRDDASSATATR
jgi:hypothetical protein